MIPKIELDFNYRPDLRQTHVRVGNVTVAIDDRELAIMMVCDQLKPRKQVFLPEDKPLPQRLTRKIVI